MPSKPTDRSNLQLPKLPDFEWRKRSHLPGYLVDHSCRPRQVLIGERGCKIPDWLRRVEKDAAGAIGVCDFGDIQDITADDRQDGVPKKVVTI